MNTLLSSYYVNLVGFPFLNLTQETVINALNNQDEYKVVMKAQPDN